MLCGMVRSSAPERQSEHVKTHGTTCSYRSRIQLAGMQLHWAFQGSQQYANQTDDVFVQRAVTTENLKWKRHLVSL